MRKTNKKGFTIVELVIVIAVIAILAAVMIPTFAGVVEDANEAAALQTAQAAYKEAYADAMADGIITTTTGFSGEKVTKGNLTFVFTNTNGSISAKVYNKLADNTTTEPAAEDASIKGYNIRVTDGVVSATKG